MKTNGTGMSLLKVSKNKIGLGNDGTTVRNIMNFVLAQNKSSMRY